MTAGPSSPSCGVDVMSGAGHKSKALADAAAQVVQGAALLACCADGLSTGRRYWIGPRALVRSIASLHADEVFALTDRDPYGSGGAFAACCVYGTDMLRSRR